MGLTGGDDALVTAAEVSVRLQQERSEGSHHRVHLKRKIGIGR